MLAYIYHSDKRLTLENVAKPEPEKDEALLKVTACSICGTDMRTKRFGSAKINDGRIIGHEVVGEIVSIPVDLAGSFAVGDKVAIAPAIGCGLCPSCKAGRTNMCDDLKTLGYQYEGGFAEYMVIPRQVFTMGNVYRLPDREDISYFTLSEPLACTINAHTYLKIKQGETVVIFGSGIIGCMHAELAQLSGAGQVIIIETDDRRIEQGKALLDTVHYINSTKTDIFAEISRLTEGKGADVAIIACSVGQAQSDGLKLLAKCGRISLFGGLPGESIGYIDSNLIHYRELSVYGVHASTPAQNRQAMQMIRDGQINVEKYITRRYPLNKIEDAFTDIQAGQVMKAIVLGTPR